MNNAINIMSRTFKETSNKNDIGIERLCEEINFWNAKISEHKNKEDPIFFRMSEALELAQIKLDEYWEDRNSVIRIENNQQHLITPQDIQDQLSAKRLALGYKKFFGCVAAELPTTLKKVDDTTLVRFGRRYRDDIFLSVQVHYPNVSLHHIRELSKNIWAVTVDKINT